VIAMRQIYIRKFSETFVTAPSGYVYSDRIKPGLILHVHNCFAYSPQFAINEIIMIGIKTGGSTVLIRARSPGVAAEGMSAINDFFCGEGDEIFAYFPNASGTDAMELHVIGCMLSLNEFRAQGE